MARRKKNSSLKFDIIGILLALAGIIFYISLFSKNSGLIGNGIKNILLGLFGLGAYIFPIIIIILGIAAFYMKQEFKLNSRFFSFCAFLLATITILFISNYGELSKLSLNWSEMIKKSYTLGIEKTGGGAVGAILGFSMLGLIGINGSIAVIVAIYIVAIMLFTQTSITDVMEMAKIGFLNIIERIKERKEIQKLESKKIKVDEFQQLEIDEPIEISDDKKVKILNFTKQFDKNFKQPENVIGTEKTAEKNIEKNEKHNDIKDGEGKVISIKVHQEKSVPNYKIPPTSLLSLPVESKQNNGKKEVMTNVKILEDTLKNFGVSATVSQVSVGPTITRYELSLSPGVKVSKIVNLSDDLQLSLASPGIRIEAPIPGKAAIGIEVPNKDVSSVFLREVIESDEFKNQKSKITFALGKDVAGANLVGDLAKMPHLLIAGSTGSGKSVCINTLIISILYKSTPDEVRMLMIDPKVVELSVYKNIPHLLIPVVTDPKKAAGALNWAVQEMTDRYKKFAANSVRDITGYNSLNKEGVEKLPLIVVIIDELADLMMVAPSEVEDSICRLAQMARAAGIHLVVATQRPSVDVITGLIKANIPSRISFAVSSQIDSRTILDMAGAEKLLGKGDMLYYPVGEAKPVRIQGAFISEKEVEKTVNFIKEQVAPSYNEEMIKELDESVEINEDEDVDELLKDAIQLVVDSGQASILMLQRRLKIGYSRAARLIDQMEERRIIGGFEGSKPRKVLVSKEQLSDME